MKQKILLVDDDQFFLLSVKAGLEAHGFTVLTAANGDECLAALRQGIPDLIVLDVMMSSLSEGFELARKLRSTDEYKQIPLIMLTAVNQEFYFDYKPDSVWMPVDVFLEKPVEIEDLIVEINKVI